MMNTNWFFLISRIRNENELIFYYTTKRRIKIRQKRIKNSRIEFNTYFQCELINSSNLKFNWIYDLNKLSINITVCAIVEFLFFFYFSSLFFKLLYVSVVANRNIFSKVSCMISWVNRNFQKQEECVPNAIAMKRRLVGTFELNLKYWRKK